MRLHCNQTQIQKKNDKISAKQASNFAKLGKKSEKVNEKLEQKKLVDKYLFQCGFFATFNANIMSQSVFHLYRYTKFLSDDATTVMYEI